MIWLLTFQKDRSDCGVENREDADEASVQARQDMMVTCHHGESFGSDGK